LAPAHARPTQTSPKIFSHPQLLICRSKNYELCTLAKLIPKRMFTKSFKKCKNKMRSSGTTETGLFLIGTICPLGVKPRRFKVDLVLQGVKEALYFTLNAIILQSM
jgi:hypothetical protein